MLLIGILQVVLGVILIFVDENLLAIIFKILGGVLFVLGVIQIINSQFKQKVNEYTNTSIISGALSATIGIILLTKSGLATEFLSIILGIWIMINGIMQISLSVNIKRLGIKYWPISTIIGIVIVVLGYIMIVSGQEAIKTIFNTYIGVSLAISGIGTIVTAFSSKTNVKIAVKIEDNINRENEKIDE